ncbi:alkaline phosphatase family protein [Algoriphagus yeomjeoni]|uniref:Phosphopentomutase/2, 3-bisphosphoglycerate-independent phosphoglycerate mutase family metalloenzyme n=1 Tax=Algoriphagus yeomjeoni TaxID=291403 RepID=A0A327P2L3_9BACT|nr:alkaline phosphatase family protein [Algoriphagus yeomjeoni]RAI85801.1 phosphopentomutase/2,3-bisphosphoglycerate-independent phosphoglycerate mutase family metalloenzyme [Algoriphagus yeomjeoni]
MFKNSISWVAVALLFFQIATVNAQDYKTENIILITLDGMRWQEVFTGADSLLVDDTGMIESPGSLLPDFWDVNPIKRREMLFPFLWNTIANHGQIYGNRAYGNMVNNSNSMWFSYPGYNEVLSGFADDERITSNNKINNPNVTFLEYLNQKPEFKDRVLAFGSWDVFPYIINEERSGVPVNAGFDIAEGENLSPEELLTNKMQSEIRGPWGEVRLDVFTQNYAMAALKNKKPRVLYISYGETDDWAHENHYDQYIWSAKQTDAYIKEIWDFVQSDPQYKDKTTLIITTDHGRGTSKTSWRGHGSSIADAGQIWMAAIGPDTPAFGEMKSQGQWESARIARTIFELLGMEYPDSKAGKLIEVMVK